MEDTFLRSHKACAGTIRGLVSMFLEMQDMEKTESCRVSMGDTDICAFGICGPEAPEH